MKILQCAAIIVGILCIANTLLYAQDKEMYSINVWNLRADTVQISNSKPTAIIFAGIYGCSSCYSELEQAIQLVDSSITIVILFHTAGNSVLARKQEIQRLAQLVNTRNFYFDITSERNTLLGKYTDGLFAEYKISISPSVLFLLPNKRPLFVQHTTLFGDSNSKPIQRDHCLESVKAALQDHSR